MKKIIPVLGLAGLIGLGLESCKSYEPLCPAYSSYIPYSKIKAKNEKDAQNQNPKYQSHTSQPTL
ncbi:MAG: hypothetical protein AABX44_01300 [Nanoarchaeota archaeon]